MKSLLIRVLYVLILALVLIAAWIFAAKLGAHDARLAFGATSMRSWGYFPGIPGWLFEADGDLIRCNVQVTRGDRTQAYAVILDENDLINGMYVWRVNLLGSHGTGNCIEYANGAQVDRLSIAWDLPVQYLPAVNKAGYWMSVPAMPAAYPAPLPMPTRTPCPFVEIAGMCVGPQPTAAPLP